MKRLCVFAHWDKDNVIDEYVLYYLKSLKDVCDEIIFVSDCNLEETEKQKLSDVADVIIAQKHGEYDFGSYKRGFFYAKENNMEFDELLFVNDSCYGPFYSLKPIFDKMSKKKCDFWGLTKNSYGIKKEKSIGIPVRNPHIQSYFMLFKKQICENIIFINFMKNIHKENSKEDIINNYELKLTSLLESNNFNYKVFINKYSHTENCLSSKWKRLIKWYHFPFIKTSLIRDNEFFNDIKVWQKTIKSVSNYPTELIIANAKKYKDVKKNLQNDLNFYRKIRYLVLNNCPMEIRIIVIFLEKYGYKILNTLFFHKLKKF